MLRKNEFHPMKNNHYVLQKVIIFDIILFTIIEATYEN